MQTLAEPPQLEGRIYIYLHEREINPKAAPASSTPKEAPASLTRIPAPQWRTLTNTKHVRLVSVMPEISEKIICKAEDFSLDDAPEYEAISYSWTTSPGTGIIVCDGVEVEVTQSLYDALTAVRKTGKARRVWADALCINQTDVEERSRQVRNIGRIFGGASMVWIFLGEESDDTRGALDIIERASESRQKIQRAEDLEIVLRLFERPWFERLWVVQEVCFAKKAIVVHGSDFVPWMHVSSLSAQLQELFTRSTIPSSRASENIAKVCRLEEIRSKFNDPEQGCSMLDLVLATSKFRVTDPRDKIFALTGLAKDVTEADWELSPDYASSVEDVYHRFALWTLAKRGDFRLLSFGKDPDVHSQFSLPSWVPDLSVTDQVRTPAMLAMSDDPADPRKYITGAETISEESVALFSEVPDIRLSFRTPTRQWKCADGISRPLRPAIRSWFVHQVGQEYFYGLSRATFSGDNKILHVLGREVDCLSVLGPPGFTDLSTEDSRLLFLLASERRQWNKLEANTIGQLVQDALEKGGDWLMNCAKIASCANDLPKSSKKVNTVEFALTLTCFRLLSGLPDPYSNDNDVLRSLGITHYENCWCWSPPLKIAEGLVSILSSEDFVRQRSAFEVALFNGNISLQPDQSVLQQLAGDKFRGISTDIFPTAVHWSRYRRVGATEQGHLANFPIGAQVGDIVCNLLGGSVLYVLRPCPDGYYTLIGECYIHGLMHGEAGTPGWNKDGRVFAIR